MVRECKRNEVLQERKLLCTAVCFCRKRVSFYWERFQGESNLRIEAYRDLEQEPVIKIGEGVCFNYNVHIGAINRIEIGDRVLVGSNVLITDHDHGDTKRESLLIPPMRKAHVSKGSVLIGANSVVGGKNIPDYCVVAGNPARIFQR